MTDAMREKISALLDSELSGEELNKTVDQLRDQGELRQIWDRYHLIGDVIRGEAVGRIQPSIAERVRESVDREPAILATPKPPKIPIKWMRPTAGVALAASVAVLAIMVAPHLVNTGSELAPRVTARTPQPVNQPPGIPSANLQHLVTAKQQHTVQPVTGNTVPPAKLYLKYPATRWKNLARPATVTKLNSYLVEHSEYAIQSGIKGVAPYAAFVGYDAEQ